MKVGVLVVLLLAGMAFISGASRAEEKVMLDFRQADINEVAEFFSQIFEVNMVVDPECGKGRVTVYSPEGIAVARAWESFLAILATLELEALVYEESLVLLPPRERE